MNSNDHGRKAPSLSDLEAFEKLLRESLHDEPVASTPGQPSAPMTKADHDAMAELTRLIEQPLDFSLPEVPAAATAPAIAPPPPAPLSPAPEPVAAPEPAPSALHAHLEAEFARDWPAQPQVETHLGPVHGAPEPVIAPPLPEDPLAAFEEELRRFDASRLSVPAETRSAPEPAPAPQPYPEPVYEAPAAPAAYRQETYQDTYIEPDFSPRTPSQPYPEPAYAPAPQPYALEQPHLAPAFPEAAPVTTPSPLDAMEERLAAEAAAANYATEEPQTSDVRRSRGVFMALGGLAVAGLAVVGGVFAFGGGKKQTASGDVPVIAAKTEPAKEKPADPGGVEIPNQNAQVLSGRDVTKDTGPAKQVVNTTEQPLDLKEVTRRESVRIVSPNPFQQGTPTPASESPSAAQKPADVEARRVTSVRVPTGAEAAGMGAAAVAGGAAIASMANTNPARATTPPKPESTKINVPSAAELNTPPERIGAPKSEARPTNRTESPKKAETPKAETPKATTPAKVANASATPKAKAPEKTSPDKVQRSANAPLQLSTDGEDSPAPKAKAAPAAAGSFAVQLASRPTESDARSAATSLGAKYASALGGKAARVVSGEANGQTVYRVRAGGYSQQAATEACNRIKAAGGGCFITKQ